MRFEYVPLFPLGKDRTSYEQLKLSSAPVKTVRILGKSGLLVEPSALRFLAREAVGRINFYFRKSIWKIWLRFSTIRKHQLMINLWLPGCSKMQPLLLRASCHSVRIPGQQSLWDLKEKES